MPQQIVPQGVSALTTTYSVYCTHKLRACLVPDGYRSIVAGHGKQLTGLRLALSYTTVVAIIMMIFSQTSHDIEDMLINSTRD